MPWLPLYATETDLKWLLEVLGENPELAFLVSAGEHRWIAVKKVEYSADCRICLWHIPSGPLPLLREKGQEIGVVGDPWKGWTEERAGAGTSNPYFGAGHVGMIWLNARAQGKHKKGGIGLSSFEWIGNRYSLLGRPAP